MSKYNRIPVIKSSPTLKGTPSGSVRSYDSNVMELYSELDDDDGGFRSLPEYALARIFSIPYGHDTDSVTSGSVQSVPSITMTPGSPEVIVRKKRRAPEPPTSLTEARTKFPSSDDIVERRKSLARIERAKYSERPLSFTDGSHVKKSIDLWDELLDKLYKSPSPEPSPRLSRARTIMQKIRSPRLARTVSKKRSDKIRRLEEEAGFRCGNLSNSSSFDETDGTEIGLQFGILGWDLERDVEFEVKFNC